MISLEDCVGLSGLTEEEVLAIAEHEHIPEIAASALGQYLSRQEQIRDMIVHDIRQAQQGQDKQHTLWCCCMYYIIPGARAFADLRRAQPRFSNAADQSIHQSRAETSQTMPGAQIL
jgi:hypothetical protein